MIKEWLIKIDGENFDLQYLSRQLSSPECSVIEEDGTYYLKSDKLNFLKDISEIDRNTTQLLAFINGVAKIHFDNFQAISVEKIIQVDEDGQRTSFVIAPIARVRGRSKVSVSISGGQAMNSPGYTSPLESSIAMALKDEIVAKALRILGSRELSFENLFKVYEIVQNDVGSRIHQCHWATNKEVSLFTQTANSSLAIGDDARHGYQKNDPPQTPMSLSEAESLIKKIMRNWLQLKSS